MEPAPEGLSGALERLSGALERLSGALERLSGLSELCRAGLSELCRVLCVALFDGPVGCVRAIVALTAAAAHV